LTSKDKLLLAICVRKITKLNFQVMSVRHANIIYV